jgi:acyl-CoA dehydrogenase
MKDPLATLRAHGPSPEAESAALGSWLLHEAGLAAEGVTAVAPAPPRESGPGSVTLHRVPFARDADRIAFLSGDRLCVVDRVDVEVRPRDNLAGDARDTVVVSGGVEACPRVDPEALLERGALARAVVMAGALERISAMTVEHASVRRQFGRPIGSFQAVQHLLVTVAQQASLVGMAADAAIARRGAFEIGAAKLLANRAAILAGRAAHQVHGARGTTLEHALPTETRRLWAWRSEYGDEHEWSRRLGAALARAGADRLYPAIAGGSAEVAL